MQTPDDDQDRTEELDETLFPSPSDRPLQGPVSMAVVRQGVVLRDRYLLGAPIANTGQSIVFAARDMLREPGEGEAIELAVKVLSEPRRQMPYAIARLKREFRQTQSLRHPGVVRMYDLDRELDTWFITMERLEGMSLKRRLERGLERPMNTAEALKIAFACADVLEFAHGQGTPHGDFKPGNVFLEPGGGVRVLDFGTAPDVFADSSEVAADEGQIPRAATRAYASPEVLDGQPAEPRDDIYSFACVVYEMLAGRHPFDRVPANRARDETRQVEPIAQLTPEQNAELRKGLAWTRDARPASAAQFMQSLLKPPAAQTAAQMAAAAASVTLPPPPSSPTRWGLWLGVAALVAVVGWWMFYAAQHSSVAASRQSRPAPIAPAPASAPPAPTPTPAEASASLPVIAADDPAVEPAVPVAESPAPAVEKPSRPPPQKPRASVRVANALVFVTEGAPAAALVLQRDGDRMMSFDVAWTITDGSAHSGQDFDGPAEGVVKFRSGQTSRALYIPLVNDAATELQEYFTVTLSSKSADFGANPKITVTIDDDD